MPIPVIGRSILALLGIATAIVFFTQSIGYPAAAGQMPLIYSVVVGALSCLMFFETMLKMRRGLLQAEESEKHRVPGAGMNKLPGMVALTLAYVLLLFPLGYIIATLLFLGISLLLLRHVSLTMAITGTLILVAGICVIFIWFLNLPMPLMPSLPGV